MKGKVALVNSSVLKPQGVWLLGAPSIRSSNRFCFSLCGMSKDITLVMFLGLRCQIWKFLVFKHNILSMSGSEVNQT